MVYGIHKTKTPFFCIQDLNENRLIKIYLILVTNSKHIDCMKIVKTHVFMLKIYIVEIREVYYQIFAIVHYL